MKIVVVIPTYNEAENIKRMIPALAEEFLQLKNYDCHLLVVDGNSPDGTFQIVKEFSDKYAWVHLLLEKQKSGLGVAYTYGFSYALKEMHADVIVEMDADFQHDPRDIKKLITEISGGYDYVIGSRFTKGGSIPRDWALYRKFLSVGGNIFSGFVLGIYNLTDFTSGFKASRVKGFLDKIDLNSISSDGFAYKIDLLFKMYQLGAKFKEVPIVFGLRDRGDSKMEASNFMDSIKVVFTLRFNKSKSFFKFVIVGFTGLFVDAGLFNVLRITFSSSVVASFISGLFGMLTTFTLNNFWSFGERKLPGVRQKAYGFLTYILISIVPIIIRTKLVFFANLKFGDTILISNIAFFIGIAFGLVWNYLFYSKIIWKRAEYV